MNYKKIIAFVMSVVISFTIFSGVQVDAKEVPIVRPNISVKVIDGKGVKVTIKKSADAEGFEIYGLGKSTLYDGYKELKDSYTLIAKLEEDGSKKRTYVIKTLPPGNYKIAVRSYNSKKFGSLVYSDMSKAKKVKLIDEPIGYKTEYDFSKVKKGEIIKFGSYEQDNDFTNGKEEIEWIVLSKTKSTMFLISRYAIDCLPYNAIHEGVTWETCSLRAWLNNVFYESAFNSSEAKMIKKVTNENFDNIKYNTPGGNDTKDKVFILSQIEARDSAYGYDENYDSYDINRRCSATPYSIAQGSVDSIYDKTVDDDNTCQWWIRTPGGSGFVNGFATAFISTLGDVRLVGQFNSNNYTSVRPAIIVKLK